MSFWDGILDPARAIDWSSAGVSGGIPARADCVTPECATLLGSVNIANINSAITSAPANTAVRVPAGAHTLPGFLTIRKSNITLRGAGASQTKLVFTGNAGGNCFFSDGASLCVDSGENHWGAGALIHTANWTGGYAKGTTVLTIGSIPGDLAGLQIGSQLFLDQLDDTTDGFPAVGDIFVCASCSGEGGGHARPGRNNLQIVTVQAISGNNVTISPALYMPNWRAGQSPGAWWGNNIRTGVGIEDMTLDYGGNGGHPGIMFFNVRDSWVKGVRGLVPSEIGGTFFNHVRLLQVNRTTIRDNYFHGDFFDGNTMYGISEEGTSDNLIQNNIVTRNGGPLECAGPALGSVVSYNFMIGNSANGAVVSSVVLHEAGESFMLFEGNSGSGVTSDIVHGSHHFITQFRNHWYGDPLTGTDTINWLQTYSRFFNVIGNVLGLTGSSYSVYELDLSLRAGNEIFSLGDKRSASYASVPTDPRVAATLMRWGNYDTVTGTVRFVAAENPSTITNFANLTNPSQSFPPSFYLAAQPTWWGVTGQAAIPWPAIGPDVLSGNVAGVAGHVNKIPARVNFETMAEDPAYPSSSPRIKIFDGSVYAGDAPPPPPPLRTPIPIRAFWGV